MTYVTISTTKPYSRKNYCCCGAVHIVSGAAFFASLTICLAMFLLIQDDGVNAYKVVVYGSFIIPAMFVMLGTAYEEPVFLMPAIVVEVFYCIISLITVFKMDNSYFEAFDNMFLAVFQDANEAMAFARLSLIFFFALTLWKIGVYNRCADYLHARHKERNAVRSQTHATTTKTYASQTPTPLYPVVI